MPASLRKAAETKSMLFPALFSMLAELDDDLETWAISTDDDAIGQTDPHNTALNAINKLSLDLGEKTVMAATSGLIQTYIKSEDWKIR
jgi:hypothetical protein